MRYPLHRGENVVHWLIVRFRQQLTSKEGTMRGERGFTLIELMIVFVATGVIVGVVSACCALCAGNFWYSEQGVLRALQSDHPNITKVELIERHVYDYSIVVAKQGDQEMMFFLDSNMLFNYKFQRAEQFSMNSAVYRF